MPSSWTSLRMEANSADSFASGMLGEPRELQFTEPEGEGCLKAASEAWLVLPGRCTMMVHVHKVRCFSLNRWEFVISSRVRLPKILVRGL